MVLIKKKPIESLVFKYYWKFAANRQLVFFNKLHDNYQCSDPILNKYYFTNAYRASDRVSQYLIKNVIYKSKYTENDLLFRILLFKLFNKTETWEFLKESFGEPTLDNFDVNTYDKKLTQGKSSGAKIYSSAYIMPSTKSKFGSDSKHTNHLRFLKHIFETNIAEKLLSARSLEELYLELLACPGLGPFLAFQYAIDINYSPLTKFKESEFVVPGPGALNGIKKCFKSLGDYSESELIHYLYENQEEEFEKHEIEFKTLWGRPLQPIDIQNLFCEVDKYLRVARPDIKGLDNRTRIKRKYNGPREKINCFYPPKWGINEKINKFANELSNYANREAFQNAQNVS